MFMVMAVIRLKRKGEVKEEMAVGLRTRRTMTTRRTMKMSRRRQRRW